MTTIPFCPICISSIEGEFCHPTGSANYNYMCPRCGCFELSSRAKIILENQPELYNHEQRLLLSHLIRKHWEFDKLPIKLNEAKIKSMLENNVLPNPAEQANNLILWVGDNQKTVGSYFPIPHKNTLETLFGVSGFQDLVYIKNELQRSGILVEIGSPLSELRLQLSFLGWRQYDALKKGVSVSNRVFMAMRFGVEMLDKLFEEFYKPKLKDLGYDLFRLDEQPKAGSITNRMRVAIREAKFVIADVSYSNRGAYWEAGFGEGLGKHVIYSVNESTLDTDHHFDVQGQQAVIWTEDKMQKAADDLEAIIKATFI